MGKPRAGFTYPTTTGENTPKGAAFGRIRSEFPGMQIWSVYYSGTDLPSWNEACFADEPANENLVYIVSIKHTSVVAIGACIATMPAHLRGRVLIILHHEPDQWRSVEDPRGDPSPIAWADRQVDFADLREESVWRNWIEHWVCFTEDRYRTDTAVWEANWGGIIRREPRIDGVMFDCFNIGRSVVRLGADIFGKPLSFVRREYDDAAGRLIIREFGQVTPVDQPTDSPEVADAVLEDWEYAKTQNAVDDVFWGIVWYYNHNNVLADPTTIRRPLTMEVWRHIVADANDDELTEYERGFVDGAASRQAEVDELTGRVATLTTLLAQANAAIPEAEARGVAEGRDQVIDAVDAAMAPYRG